MFLFPYESIRKDTNIVLYGTGDMGMDYILQLQKTDYCKIIFALDRSADEKIGFPVDVFFPEYIKNIPSVAYDCVLIAVQDRNHSCTIKNNLISYGVEPSKIMQIHEVSNNFIDGYSKPELIDSDKDPNVMRISFYAYGGLGDTLIVSALIMAIRKILTGKVQIDYYSKYPDTYLNFPFIDNVYKSTQFSDSYDYDFSAFVLRSVNFRKLNLNKIKRFSETLYSWCVEFLRLNNIICDNSSDNFRYSQYTMMKGENRIEGQNVCGILPYDRHSPVYMEWDLVAFQHFIEFGLGGVKFITISSGIENCNTVKNPKLWEIDKFNELVSLLKRKYPDTLVVNIGQNYNFGKIEGVDTDLVGKTTLDDVKVILKQSLLHIGVEGGLVHMNHFLYGKSCCLFGPTSKQVLGYAENININSGFPKQCSNGCEGVMLHWASYGCFLGDEALCMKSLSAERVFGEISEYLDEIESFQADFRIYVTPILSSKSLADAILASLETANRIAVIGRIEDRLLESLSNCGKKVTVFARDLGDGSDYTNCKYALRCSEIGVTAEYGNIYNISAKSENFDAVVNFTLENEKYPEFALEELLRVVGDNGILLLVCKNADTLVKVLATNGVDTQALSHQPNDLLLAIHKKIIPHKKRR